MGTGWSQDGEASQEQQDQEPCINQFHDAHAKPNALKDAREVKLTGTSSKAAERKPQVLVPHNFEDILKDVDSAIDTSSMDKLYHQLCAGIYLKNKKQKYWIEGQANKNCFFLYGTGLSITWVEDQRYWHWITLKDTSEEFMAPLLTNVAWLEVHGKFNTARLSPGTLYEVSFVIMLADPAYGWKVPVNLRFILADGTKQERKESLVSKLREQWLKIPVGKFKTTPENTGEMEISLYEYEGGQWKKGLIIKGVLIQPKIES